RVAEGAVPFRAPAGWTWGRLCLLLRVMPDGDPQPPPRADRGIAFLTIGNVTTGQLDFDGCRLVPESYFRALPAYRTPSKGDILYTVVGATFGRPALVESEREFCVQRHIAILKPAKTLEIRFLLLLLASPLVYDQAASSTTGTAQPTIALRPLRNFAVPVPPLAEQRRIVAKVDELMGLCNQLEASITTGGQTRSRLLEAVLHKALEPA
ncbi:MAG: restriction endonuclease subunit S, partial [Sphingomonas parapaucimobilis]